MLKRQLRRDERFAEQRVAPLKEDISVQSAGYKLAAEMSTNRM